MGLAAESGPLGGGQAGAAEVGAFAGVVAVAAAGAGELAGSSLAQPGVGVGEVALDEGGAVGEDEGGRRSGAGGVFAQGAGFRGGFGGSEPFVDGDGEAGEPGAAEGARVFPGGDAGGGDAVGGLDEQGGVEDLGAVEVGGHPEQVGLLAEPVGVAAGVGDDLAAEGDSDGGQQVELVAGVGRVHVEADIAGGGGAVLSGVEAGLVDAVAGDELGGFQVVAFAGLLADAVRFRHREEFADFVECDVWLHGPSLLGGGLMMPPCSTSYSTVSEGIVAAAHRYFSLLADMFLCGFGRVGIIVFLAG